jgi:tRNA (cytidine/uridine-2'-O-)-methyltransferase
MFGKESAGAPKEIHEAHENIRIPMIKSSARSLNLSNTVAIVAYEALRQIGFPNMK